MRFESTMNFVTSFMLTPFSHKVLKKVAYIFANVLASSSIISFTTESRKRRYAGREGSLLESGRSFRVNYEGTSLAAKKERLVLMFVFPAHSYIL